MSSAAPSELERNSQQAEEDARQLTELVMDRQGTWQERAEAIRTLQKQGLTAEELYDYTLVTTEKQTQMVVAAQVFSSMQSADTPSDVLAAFTEDDVELLYEMRLLTGSQRKAAADYIVANNLDRAETRELARAIKDHERRPEGRKGFTPAPGDCLAFMLYLAAGESRSIEQKEKLVQRGQSVAETDTARARFSEFES
eukprot:SM000015S01187  [mRNA]  locus=s15:349167:350399:+ [translate_table: standard]